VEKWLPRTGAVDPTSVSDSEASTLEDLFENFEHNEEMRLLPLDQKAVLVLVAAALLPMLPLLAPSIGLTEILSMLGKFLV
jgi:hypothetical protein